MCNTRLGVTAASEAIPGRRLARRFFSQIRSRSDASRARLCDTFAIGFRPGDRTGSFVGKAIRPLGQSVLVVLSYGRSPTDGHCSMPLRGFRAEVGSDGMVRYGARNNGVFRFDAARRPFSHSKGDVLNPYRNPSLYELMLRLDGYCQYRATQTYPLPVIPQFPRILLGFAPGQPPAFEETPALRELAAKAIDIPIDRLGTNGTTLLDRLLHDVWESSLIPPCVAGNDTGLLLVSADLCSQARRALRIFEDFRHLLGVKTWNPARELQPVRAPNPAVETLRSFGLEGCRDLGEVVTEETLQTLVRDVRQRLDTVAEHFATDDIYDGLLAPGVPLMAWHEALPKLRAMLSPSVAECTTDDDLLRAARSPRDALVSSGACKLQVLQRRSADDREAFCFSPDDLGRRIEANLWVDSWPDRRRPAEAAHAETATSAG